MAPARLRPLLYLLGAVIFWGASFAATKGAYASLPPMMVMWLRMIVASVTFLPFWHVVPRPRYQPGDWKLLGLASLFIPCLYFLLEGYAVRFTTSSQAGVVSAIMPLMVAAGAWLVLGERLRWQGVVGIGVSIAGVIVLSTTGVTQESAPAPALGNLLEVGAMIAATGSTLTIKKLSTRYDPWFLTAFQSAVGVVFFAPLALLSGPIEWSAVSRGVWLSIAYLGVLSSLGAFGLYNSALRMLPANRAALAINLIPAVALFAGWVLLGEVLSGVQIAACIVIVAAVMFAEVSGHVSPSDPAPR